jgi:hypothetical protein
MNGVDAAEISGIAGTGVINGASNFITGLTSPVDTTKLTAAAGSPTLMNAGQALPAELAGLTLEYQFEANHVNPLLSKAVARDISKVTDLGAAAIAP